MWSTDKFDVFFSQRKPSHFRTLLPSLRRKEVLGFTIEVHEVTQSSTPEAGSLENGARYSVKTARQGVLPPAASANKISSGARELIFGNGAGLLGLGTPARPHTFRAQFPQNEN